MLSFTAAAAATILSLPLLSYAAPTPSPLVKRAYPPVGACSGACGGVHDPNVVIRGDGASPSG